MPKFSYNKIGLEVSFSPNSVNRDSTSVATFAGALYWTPYWTGYCVLLFGTGLQDCPQGICSMGIHLVMNTRFQSAPVKPSATN
ncbi:hypothetical protein TorRG33x02_329860 [Trema orientale]|uniref:Uncharacterized protein n=1 Tax=Trema orientale TaxID=63057 RepID=A0A2P5B812_TREOI|nr:hypothetical protein TorRG33x02_329860 [Trema orientale]